jgi:integrase/recombinase XerD
LTTLDCRRWLIGLAKEAYSVSSINVAHGSANVFFRFLITEGDLDANPFEPLPYLPKAELLPRYLTRAEVERLMSVPDTSTYYGILDRAVMELLYSSGLRVAELINLRLSDVNLDKRRILCMGKRSKRRIVIFGRTAREWLEKYLAAREHVPGSRKSPHLFLKDDGGRIYSTYVWRHVKAHGMMTGLNDVTPRVLRHSFATHLHAGGASIRHVQVLLGHSDMESTQIYTHMVITHLRKSYDIHHLRAKLKRGPPRAEGAGADK